MLEFVLKRPRRALLVDKISDAANLAVGGLVFGQSLSDRLFSPLLAALGLALWVLLIGCAIVLAEDEP